MGHRELLGSRKPAHRHIQFVAHLVHAAGKPLVPRRSGFRHTRFLGALLESRAKRRVKLVQRNDSLCFTHHVEVRRHLCSQLSAPATLAVASSWQRGTAVSESSQQQSPKYLVSYNHGSGQKRVGLPASMQDHALTSEQIKPSTLMRICTSTQNSEQDKHNIKEQQVLIHVKLPRGVILA